MKKIILFLALSLGLNFSYTQTDPTLAVGLETLTFNKGVIDVELLTEIILEKQNELKQEALKRFIFNLFPKGNYTTKFYLQSSMHILLNEKNPEVIKRELMEIVTNYSLALGFTVAYDKINPKYVDFLSDAFNDNLINDGWDLFKDSKKAKYKEQLRKKIKAVEAELENSSTQVISKYVQFKNTLYNTLKATKNSEKLDDIINILNANTSSLKIYTSLKNSISKLINDYKNEDLGATNFNKLKKSLEAILTSKEDIYDYYKTSSSYSKAANKRLLRRQNKLQKQAFRKK